MSNYQERAEWIKSARAIHKQAVDAAVLGLEMVVDSARKTGRLDLNACVELLSHAEFAQNHVDRLDKKLKAISEAEAKFKDQANFFERIRNRIEPVEKSDANKVYFFVCRGGLK